MPVFRIELHNHCGSDPQDALDYSARDLVDACVKHGVGVVAITPHRELFDEPDAVAYARSRNVLLIPGVEKMVEGRELVLLNVLPHEIPHRMDRSDLEKLRRDKGESLFVLAPHPFYPRDSCIGPVLDEFAALVDAVEWCHLFIPLYNPNLRAAKWAEANGRPVIATSDTHDLALFARNHAEVEADSPDAVAVFRALRAGRIRNRHRPYGLRELAKYILLNILAGQWRKWRRKPHPPHEA